MDEVLAALGAGIVVFAATNVDDILLLGVFFADPGCRPRRVVLGQFLGISVLVGVSAVCAWLAVAVPPEWVALLGLAPLALGIRGLWRLFRCSKRKEDGEEWEQGAKREGSASHGGAVAGSGPSVVAVASITVANGGDNLGAYVPMFAASPRLVPLYAAVFAVMTAVWCAAGYYLVNNAFLARRVEHHGRAALPFVLVLLGLWILSDALSLP